MGYSMDVIEDDDESQPSAEELKILQKHCKHRVVEPECSIEFLEVGEKQKLKCWDCKLEFEVTPAWKQLVYESEDQPAICSGCGSYIYKGKELKEGDEWWHEKCLWPDFNDDEW